MNLFPHQSRRPYLPIHLPAKMDLSSQINTLSASMGVHRHTESGGNFKSSDMHIPTKTERGDTAFLLRLMLQTTSFPQSELLRTALSTFWSLASRVVLRSPLET